MGNIKRADASLNIKSLQTSDTFYAKFKSSGNDSLAVNGTAPVTFTLEDIPISDFLLQRVTFLIGADSIVNLNQFGNIDSLVNGVLFSANGDTSEIKAEFPIKTNGDTILISSNVVIDTVSFASTQSTAISGTWDLTKTYNGNAPLILNKDLKIVVKDDLSDMDYFQVSCHGILIN